MFAAVVALGNAITFIVRFNAPSTTAADARKSIVVENVALLCSAMNMSLFEWSTMTLPEFGSGLWFATM